MMKWASTLILTGVLVSCSSMKGKNGGSEIESVDLKVTKVVLKNGLTVLLSENHKLPVFSYYTYYKVGGKYETDGITGASHFLEHMMFKGAKKYGAGEFDLIVEGNGGKNNAFTTNDHTVYYELLPSEHIEKIIDLEADRMQNLLLEPKSFEKERNVVLEERRMRYENADRGKIYLSMMQELFKGTPYGTSVIGKIKDLKSVSRDQIFEYFKRFYAPNNAIIVMVGDFKTADVLKTIKEKFGNIPKSKDLAKFKKDLLAKDGFDIKTKLGREVKLKGQSPNPNFMLAFPADKIGTDNSYTLDILSSILGGGESSYLHGRYVLSKDSSMTGIYAANYTLQEAGVFFIGGEILAGKSLEKTKKDLIDNLVIACDTAITERAIQKVKNQYLVDMLSGLDTNAGVARFLGDREFYYNDYEFYKKEMSFYNAIDAKMLKSVCKKYLRADKSIFLSIWNKH